MLSRQVKYRLVSNVACGLNIALPWHYYALIFAAIMLIYFAVNALLVRKLNKISPAEVLKNREKIPVRQTVQIFPLIFTRILHFLTEHK